MSTKFKLTENFLRQFQNKEPDWGFDELSRITYLRTYSRIKEDGSQETFFDTIKRCVEGSFTIQMEHCRKSCLPWDAYKAQKSAQKMFQKMWEFKFLPPGRGLWTMGTPIVDKIGSASLCNCGFVSTKDIDKDFAEPFAWAADMLMLGVGIGYDTLGAGKVTIPRIKTPVYTMGEEGDLIGTVKHVIPDTREGWVDAIRVLLNWAISDKHLDLLKFDYSLIRPAGTPIKGFGGTASGPDPLKEGIENIKKLLMSYVSKPLDSVGIVDIMNYIGKFVVAGNVRRSAEIAIGNIEDQPFIEMKDYNKYPEELKDRRWMSNNSVYSKSTSDFSNIIKNITINGEPGIILLDNCKHYGRFIDGYLPSNHPKFDNVDGVNPCAEQCLQSYELCVSADTRILTRDGYPKIFDVMGKEVEVWNGSNWSKKIPFKTASNQKLYRVTLSDGSYLDCTSKHGWNIHLYKDQYQRIETKDLEPGMSIGRLELAPTESGTRDVKAYTIGWFIGDGYMDEDTPMVLVQEPEYKIIPDLWFGVPYKEQHPEGYARPFKRVKIKGTIDPDTGRDLRNYDTGLPEQFFNWDKQSILEFIGGWIDTDGSLVRQYNTDNYVIYSCAEKKLRDAQLLLRKVGINYSSIYQVREEGSITNYSNNSKAMWCLYIPSFECKDILTKIKIASRIGSRFKNNNAHEISSVIDSSRKQKIISIVELEGVHDTYCFTEQEKHMGVFNNVLTYQCNLVETFPANHETAEEYYDTLKYAYLYAKSVTLLPTHCEKTNQIMLQNRRIGCSQSGIQQAIKKFGIQKYLINFCNTGYKAVEHWDLIYSRWLGVPTSIRYTTVKPSGTVSILAGATPGVHCTHSEYYMRTIRIAANNALIKPLTEAGYKIEDSINDPSTKVVYFPVKEKNFTKSKYDISLWEQLILIKELQHYWADNSVSCTVTFKPEEAKDLKSAIEYMSPYVKTLSFLPLENHNYQQAPYQTCTKEEYDTYVASLNNVIIKSLVESKGERYCTNDTCSV